MTSLRTSYIFHYVAIVQIGIVSSISQINADGLYINDTLLSNPDSFEMLLFFFIELKHLNVELAHVGTHQKCFFNKVFFFLKQQHPQ